MSERRIPENLIRQTAELEGIRDIDAAYAFVTGQSPIEARLSAEELKRRMREVPIKVEINEGGLTWEKKKLLPQLIRFVQRTAVSFQDRLNEIMQAYHAERGRDAFTPEILRKMRKKGYDFPEFSILDNGSAESFLEETKLGQWADLNERNFLLVFNLPKPIARFWYRGGVNSRGRLGKKIPSGYIEWGRFYREVMPVIWHEVGHEECEGSLILSRLNDIGEHDPRRYHYVWEVESQPASSTRPGG